MTQINSLYDLIKQKTQEKGRKLRIVCDWDEVIQPLKPMAVYEIAKPDKISFKKFFERFWEIAIIKGSFSASEGRITGVEGTDEEKKSFDKYTESIKVVHDYDEGERLEREIKKLSNSIAETQGETRKNLERKKEDLIKKRQDWERKIQGKKREQGIYWKNFYRSPEWIEKITNAPYLSIAEDLLKALKEDLIERLIIISSFRKGRGKGQGVTRKNKSFAKNFANFPNCELELTEVGKDKHGKYAPYRWQWMNELMPDWDMFVDNNPNIIKETIKNTSDPNKIYVLPDYKNCRVVQGPNVYHVETTISDPKNEDFEIAVLEIKMKALEQQLTQAQNQKPPSLWKQPSTYLIFAGGMGIALLGMGIYWIIRKGTKKEI